MKKLTLLFACGAFILASCGSGNNTTPAESTTTEETPSAPSSDVPGVDDLVADNTIILTGNDQMKYDATLFKVTAGQEISLSLTNVGSLPVESMAHDVVVLKPGSDVAAFGTAVAQAEGFKIENISDDLKAQIVAETKMLGPGESDQITFTLSEPGTYPFLCTFPGHFGSMQGKIVAVAAETAAN